MKLTIDWLKEHIETNASVDEIINTLERMGLPCENVYKAFPAWSEVTIVRITSKEKHPNADKLNLYDIELANGKTRKLVCADGTLEVGMHVPYASYGVIAPGLGIKLKVAKIRGIESPGMLCSANDLCLPLDGSGVIKCHSQDFGKTIAQVFESSAIIEIEVTPNRGDVLSIRGIARALSHHGIGKLKPLKLEEQTYSKTSELASIESKDCTALTVALVEYSAKPTTALIANRLILTGHKPTGIDIVDLTNYVAHELGNPMHAFDATKLDGPIKITNTKNASEYEALTGEKITLEKGTLVIEDNCKIVSWPGVVGGMNSKTEPTTSKILLETGVFKIDSMQRRKNKITTSAAKKFEYGIDPENLEATINRYCYLLGTWAQKAESHAFDKINKIQFDLSFIKKILGKEITLEQLKAKLEPRGFKISESLEITVPSYKFFDIHSPNCIVEEYAIGDYEDIDSINLPAIIPNTNKTDSIINSLTNSAIENGFMQTYNFTLTNEENLEFVINKPSKTKVTNSSNLNYSVLRASMIPQLLKIANWHINNAHQYTSFFEIGLIYDDAGQHTILTAISKNPDELLRIFYHALESNNLEVPNKTIPYGKNTISAKWQDSGATFVHNDKTVAICGRIKQSLTKHLIDSKTEFYALEIYPNTISSLDKKHYAKPSTQAPVYKDISFTLQENIYTNILIDFLNKNGYDFSIFDIYPSSDLSKTRNFGLRFKFMLENSLSKSELNEKTDKIKELVLKELNISSS